MVSLPTGYGKSVIFHLCGRLLCSKNNLDRGVTVVISPLNVIQMDQMKLLREKQIKACRVGCTTHFFSDEKVMIIISILVCLSVFHVNAQPQVKIQSIIKVLNCQKFMSENSFVHVVWYTITILVKQGVSLLICLHFANGRLRTYDLGQAQIFPKMDKNQQLAIPWMLFPSQTPSHLLSQLFVTHLGVALLLP